MDLTALTDGALHDLSARIAAEWERRRAHAVWKPINYNLTP